MKNSEYNMIIRNTDEELKNAFLAKAGKLGLSISNNVETKSGIENIEIGHSISVGTSDKFHINWAKRIDYYADRGIVPVYDFVHDWSKIIARLEAYAGAVKRLNGLDQFLTDNNDTIDFDKESQEITIGNDLVIGLEEIQTIIAATNMSIDIVVDSSSESVNIGGYTLAFEELSKIEEVFIED